MRHAYLHTCLVVQFIIRHSLCVMHYFLPSFLPSFLPRLETSKMRRRGKQASKHEKERRGMNVMMLILQASFIPFLFDFVLIIHSLSTYSIHPTYPDSNPTREAFLFDTRYIHMQWLKEWMDGWMRQKTSPPLNFPCTTNLVTLPSFPVPSSPPPFLSFPSRYS